VPKDLSPADVVKLMVGKNGETVVAFSSYNDLSKAHQSLTHDFQEVVATNQKHACACEWDGFGNKRKLLFLCPEHESWYDDLLQDWVETASQGEHLEVRLPDGDDRKLKVWFVEKKHEQGVPWLTISISVADKGEPVPAPDDPVELPEALKNLIALSKTLQYCSCPNKDPDGPLGWHNHCPMHGAYAQKLHLWYPKKSTS
jgi:hypothetical protein